MGHKNTNASKKVTVKPSFGRVTIMMSLRHFINYFVTKVCVQISGFNLVDVVSNYI